MKGLSKFQRESLAEIMELTNDLGAELDGTATSQKKYIDRQKALKIVSKVIYGLFGDHPENDFRDEDLKTVEYNLAKLRELKNKVYPDRNGN